MTCDSLLFAGIDLGTSGVRGVCVDAQLQTQYTAQVSFRSQIDDRRAPQLWWQAVTDVIQELAEKAGAHRIASIAIDGTSGTMIAVDDNGTPLSHALLYNDQCDNQQILNRIAAHAPESAAVHGSASGLARAITLATDHPSSSILHEADWLAFKLTGITGISDENNALKSGYDPISRTWPHWIESTGISPTRLPRVVPAGQVIAPVHAAAARATGLNTHTLVVAGTTDGCASFLATGATSAGEGVTVLGSTLTIKLLSDKPVCAPEYGIYSHRIGNSWLAGGASNTGGGVLARFFTAQQIEQLSGTIDPTVASTLDYYPLTEPGERFPVNDSELKPRLSPRPDDDAQFLHGMLQGIARIEHLAYQRLQELGAPSLHSIRTVGGGAQNAKWTTIRQALLNVPVKMSHSDQAAAGTARLARDGFIAK